MNFNLININIKSYISKILKATKFYQKTNIKQKFNFQKNQYYISKRKKIKKNNIYIIIIS